jgi:L-ascorbate metabolism protein UlaG (beta-lactamase superfamily)
VGVATGFVLAVKGGPVLYHAGDTSVFGDMQLIRELYKPRVVMIPIGGFYTMGPEQAALACRLLAPETVLPIHWGTFPPLKGTPAELAALVAPGVKVVDWKPGDEFVA